MNKGRARAKWIGVLAMYCSGWTPVPNTGSRRCFAALICGAVSLAARKPQSSKSPLTAKSGRPIYLSLAEVESEPGRLRSAVFLITRQCSLRSPKRHVRMLLVAFWCLWLCVGAGLCWSNPLLYFSEAR
jgi:hypothetical protein